MISRLLLPTILVAASVAALAEEQNPAKIEAAFAKGKGTVADWTRLLEWYNSRFESPDAAALRDKRVAVILALAKHEQRAIFSSPA